MFFRSLKRGFIVFLEPVVRRFVERGYHPDTFTILGLVFNAVAAVLYGLGLFFEGGLVMVFGSITDVIDGQIARETGRGSTAGALLDSCLDRYSEALVFLGLAIHYASVGWVVTSAAAAAAMAGSLLVSYVRARAEALGYECDVGFMQRPERVIFLGAASVFGAFLGTPREHVAVALWLMAVLTNGTTFERITHVRRVARERAARDLLEGPSGDRKGNATHAVVR